MGDDVRDSRNERSKKKAMMTNDVKVDKGHKDENGRGMCGKVVLTRGGTLC